MRIGRKVAALGIAAVLVTGAGAVAVAPAQAAPAAKIGGKTLISFKKQYAMVIKSLEAIKPAEFVGSKMGFPVTGADGSVVWNSGGILIGKSSTSAGVAAMNPVVEINVPKKTAKVYFSLGGINTLLFTASHFKTKADGTSGTVWQGDLHMTKNAATISSLNKLMGLTILKPGAGVGQMRVTVTNG